MADRARLGILFVHGIGEQRAGETLATGVNALFGFLEEWLKHPPHRGAYQYLRGTIADGGEIPAHVEALITVASEGGEDTHHIVAAEAHWARAFQSPRNSRFLGWLVTLAPFTLGRHFGLKAARAWSRGDRWGKAGALGNVLMLEASWLLAPVFLLAAAVLRIAWVIPLPALRHALERVQVSLAATLGDSYAIVQDGVNRIAVMTRVSESLDWLLQQCERVVVVAHSQGAVIAAMTLDEWNRPADHRGKVSRLITYGPGIRKLYETVAVRRVGGIGPAWAAMLALPLLLTIIWAFSRALAGFETLTVGVALGNLLVMAFLASCHWAGLVGAMAEHEYTDIATLRGNIVRKGVSWTDIYASHDPVSNGPLFAPGGDVDEIEVANERSALFDHNLYWTNIDEFVPTVASRVFEGLPGPLGQIASDPATLADAIQARRYLADALFVIRIYIVGAAALTLAFSSGFVLAWGRSWLGAIGWVHMGLSGIFGDDLVPNLPKRLPAYPYEAGVLLVCTTAWILYRGCVWYWRQHVQDNLDNWLSGRREQARPASVIAVPATIFLFSVIAHEAQLGGSVALVLHFASLVVPAAVLAVRSERRARVRSSTSASPHKGGPTPA